MKQDYELIQNDCNFCPANTKINHNLRTNIKIDGSKKLKKNM